MRNSSPKRALISSLLTLVMLISICTPVLAGFSDPYGKHEPTIAITAARNINVGKNEANYDQSIWIKLYKDYLGIDLTYDWMVPQDQYVGRVNMAIASQDLPDIFPVDMRQLYQLQEAGLIADLTDVWEKGATQKVKDIYTAAGATASMQIATIDGHLYGIPEVTPIEESCHVLFIREDWRKKLDLPEPTTVENMMKLFEGFATMDPDGNGLQDTYALGLSGKSLNPAAYEMTSFANSFGAYPNTWIEKEGKVVYGGVQPEMKTVLATLADMYQKKWINPEFTMFDEAKAAEDLLNGKIGALYGLQWSMWISNAGVDLFKNDANSEIKAYPIAGILEGARPVAFNNTNRFFVVSKDCANPEIAIQMLNLIQWMGMEAGPEDMTYEYWDKEVWNPNWEYALIRPETVHFNVQRWINAHKAYASKDPADIAVCMDHYLNRLLWEGAEKYWDDGAKMRLSENEDDRNTAATWFGFTMSGEVFRIIRDVYADKLMVDKRGPIVTESMVDYQASLDTLQLTTYANIITGEESIDRFDAFAQEWDNLGGDQITDEINAYYTK